MYIKTVSKLGVFPFCSVDAAYKRCSARLCHQLFVGERASYLSYLCLFAHSGIQPLVVLHILTFLVPCCDVRFDLRIKTMSGSSLAPVVCLCLIYVLCVCLRTVVSHTS